MALHDLTDLQYLIPRAIIWSLLFLVALGDALRHRHIKRRGSQLPWGIVAVLGASMVQEVLLLAYSITLHAHNPKAGDVRRAYYVFDNLEDSMFMCLILAIAAGYCITRDNLGQYKEKVLITPAVFMVAKTAADLLLDYFGDVGSKQEKVTTMDVWTFFILYIAEVITMMAFLLALMFVFEISLLEVESVEGKEGIVGARPDVETGAAAGQPGAAQQGHTVNLPPSATENGQPLNDIYAQVTSQDTDTAQTVEDKLQNRTKVTLMKQFRWAAAACVLCYIVALVLPLFYYSEPGEEDTAVLVVLILWNAARWLFLAGLCYIFRVRETNPYLMLDEMDGGLDNDFSSQEVRTELGVLTTSTSMSHHNDGIDRNYSLGDEEEDSNRNGDARLMPATRVKSNID